MSQVRSGLRWDARVSSGALHDAIRGHREALDALLAAIGEEFERLVEACCRSIESGGKLLFFGNGGSAADAQHLATELTVRFTQDREPIAAIALTTDSSTLTAIGNDFGYDMLFARQIAALGTGRDVAIGISTSGRSPNILLALKAAKERGMTVAALSGGDGGDLRGLADPLIVVPSRTTAHIQEMHILIGHTLCGELERRLGLV